MINSRLETPVIMNYDEIKLLCKHYTPEHINNDMYFMGEDSSIRRTRIRENLSKENLPLNVRLNKTRDEKMFYLKDHKYLLEIPGVKPQSVRLKYLYLMERVIFRISFYNSSFNETSYWRQYHDYVMKENEDYVHLVYDVDYDKPLSEKQYTTIKKDILKKYHEFEKNPKLYVSMVENMNRKRRNLTTNSALRYLYHLIEEYTHTLLIP